MNSLPGEVRNVDVRRRELGENGLLFARRRRINAAVHRVAHLARKTGVDLTRIASHSRGDLRREQGGDDAVLIRGPHAAVAAQK